MSRPLAAWSLALLVSCLACRSHAPAGSGPEQIDAAARLHAARVRSVAARAAADGWSASQRRLLERQQVAAQVRQSALDWLDAQRRFDPEGALSVSVELSELRLRSAFTALAFGGLTGSDCLVARIAVYDRGAPVAQYAVRVESALGGRDWRDPKTRLARLARLLGRRVADSL